ncbi:MAG TPA: HAMP domain-containing sensor histidine kinase [Anaerolineae bacterium]|nr:HAMP domain-containing sensor histidine kinase [Anaerolineae bacterium]
MPWYKRLRWRLIGAQFLVASVGVLLMLIFTQLIIHDSGQNILRPALTNLLNHPDQLATTEQELLDAFEQGVYAAVSFAASGAVLAGIISSYLIWRTIISPLNALARSSQRIANGHYNERVNAPANSGQAMHHLTLNFNQMAESLAQIEKQRVALLGNISHELRTPLAGLKGYLEGLIDGLMPNDPETFVWMLHEVDRLTRLVNDIQNLSRIEAGQIKLNWETFDLTTTAQHVIAQLQSQAQTKNINLHLAPDAAATTFVHADLDRTKQILINLIGNAIQYTPDNGTITLNLTRQQNQVILTVTDTGQGIPPDALPLLFERFYRVDQSRARTSLSGSGIGLTISRHLAWAMGGELEATSLGLGLGSTFTLTLPTQNTT